MGLGNYTQNVIIATENARFFSAKECHERSTNKNPWVMNNFVLRGERESSKHLQHFKAPVKKRGQQFAHFILH